MIPGLRYIPDYISKNKHDELLDIIDKQSWSEDLKRRVQHYGYKYDYKNRSLNLSMFLGDLPDWVLSIAMNFRDDELIKEMPDQVIINEYEPGQGIASHIDCIPCFGNTIISLSLGSTCIMEFTHVKSLAKKFILLQPASLIILQSEARFEWKHGIAPRKRDEYQGRELVRSRRVSMTFRKMLLSN